MEKGYLKVAAQALKGWKAFSTESRENEFVVKFAHGTQGVISLILKGIISVKDTGVIGKPLRELRIEDKGSFKEISLHRPKGGIVLECRYMEGEIK